MSTKRKYPVGIQSFGKSLLISTLQAVFEDRRDLFEAFTTEDGIEQSQLRRSK